MTHPTPMPPAEMLELLEPTLVHGLERHLAAATEWFPHESVPYEVGRNYEDEPWDETDSELSPISRTALEVNLLTEDNLPYYHLALWETFGGAGAWGEWVRRWTAEEGRHAIVLRDYLTVTRGMDPVQLERGRMDQVLRGYYPDGKGGFFADPLDGVVYTTLQELATRIAHRNTGTFTNDPIVERLTARIAVDENLHYVFYRDLGSAALEIDPSEILAQWDQFRELVSQFAFLHSRSAYVPYILVYGVFSSIIESMKRLQGKIFIEDINRYLAEYLSKSIVPDVYFRLGDTIYHFLIDEFQDTSPIQWHNLIPLIDNSLSQGGSLFVDGDTKQAIYGFRDADYTIMRDCRSASPFLSAEPFEKELGINYRSRSRILEFTRRVFQDLAPETPLYREAAERSGLIDYKQSPAKSGEEEGYVEVSMHDKNEENPPEKLKIQELVQDLCRRGYSLADIAVLFSPVSQ